MRASRRRRWWLRILASLVVACLVTLALIKATALTLHIGLGSEDGLSSSLGDLESTSPLTGAASLRELHPGNTSYCAFAPYDLSSSLGLAAVASSTPERTPGYRIIYNIIAAHGHSGRRNVTYSTHATAEYVVRVVDILARWNGPVSMAVFSPGTDAGLVLNQLATLCRCYPPMARLAIHLVYPESHPPQLDGIANSDDSENSCYPDPPISTYRHLNELAYPVNVARNAARRVAAELAAYQLASDVELVPSAGLVTGFLNMLDQAESVTPPSALSTPNWAAHLSSDRPKVFVIPVFEVESFLRVPATKAELLAAYTRNRAVYFHRYVCVHCQLFPGLHKWLRRLPTTPGTIQPLLVSEREFPFHRWEPIYIGTGDEPWYTEQLSWEGLQDKMTQMAEMCLLRYQFIILDGAFLVHAPGIKRSWEPGQRWRKRHQRANHATYSRTVAALANKYPKNPRCRAV